MKTLIVIALAVAGLLGVVWLVRAFIEIMSV